MRKQIDGLVVLAKDVIQQDPMSDAMFAFINARRNKLKLLVWEKNGFIVWYKRLEQHKFHWPRHLPETVVPLTGEQLNLLLERRGLRDVVAVERKSDKGCLMTFEEYERTAPVRWPARRHQLLWYLHELASPSLQQERWIEMKPGAPGQMYGFDFVIHFIFDDTDLGENPGNTLGDILIDGLEVAAVRNIADALDRVLHEVGVGRDKEDADYVSSSRWPKVIETATAAYRLMRPRLQAEGDTILPPELPGG